MNNIEVFNETITVIKTDEFLSTATLTAIQNTSVYANHKNSPSFLQKYISKKA